MQPPRVPPIITLTTDFGLADHYVGTMKGVLLSRCPGASLVDISHEVPPFSIYTGAYAIDQAAPYFPPGTIHLVVVDPGVGTARKSVLVEALEQYFVAPDNGVLSMILARDQSAKIHEITNRNLWAASVSSTFHGRDVFAPVAAAIASGVASGHDVGPVASRIELLSSLAPKETTPGVWEGRVLAVDRFGNIVTNLSAAAFRQIASSHFALVIGNHQIDQFRTTFGDAPPGLCFAYFGSSGYLEIGVNQGSAASLLNASSGDPIHLRL